MTLIAGIISRDPNQTIPVSACESLKRLISRNTEDRINIFSDAASFIVNVDIGAYGVSAVETGEDGSITLIAGEPLLSSGNGSTQTDRKEDTKIIHNEIIANNWNILRKAQGTFCAVNYQPSVSKITLIPDKLGLRPLYYWINERYVIFATALRILEGVAEVPKVMDIRAVTEVVGLSYPLGNRTPFADVFMLKAAETVQITQDNISYRNYWKWDEIEVSADSEEDLLSRLYKAFNDAVARRIGTDRTTLAYLSGGLDSRCVVAALCSQDVRVYTFNFARQKTQDQLFGFDFAQKLQTIHKEVPKEPGNLIPDYSSLMAQAWKMSEHREEFPAEHSALVWNGEGGSVALGHVHLNEKIADCMRAGNFDASISEYMEKESIYVSPKLFQPKIFDTISEVIKNGIRQELDSFNCSDPARNFYFYLMQNDQRRKLAEHFENIDLHRLELQSPFLDSAFLAVIASIPLDLCLRHKFYVKWLSHFDSAVKNTPWQAYPNHEPCPLPAPSGLEYQWSAHYQAAEKKARKKTMVKQASQLLQSDDFPDKILSKKNLRVVFLIHSTGWRDYDYIIENAQTYHKYWKKCGGNYVLPNH